MMSSPTVTAGRVVTLLGAALAAASLVSGCSVTEPPPARATSSAASTPAPGTASASSASSAPAAKPAFALAGQVLSPGGFDLVGKVTPTTAAGATAWSAVLRSRDAAASAGDLAAAFVEANPALAPMQTSAVAGGTRLTAVVSDGAHLTVDVVRPAQGSPVLARVLSVTLTR